MSLMNTLRKFMKRVYQVGANNSPLSKEYVKQKKILEKFSEPTSNIHRSLYQYQCQMIYVPYFIKFLQNIISLLILLVYLIWPFKYKKNESSPSNIAIFLYEGVTSDIIPKSLKNKHKNILSCTYNDGFYLGVIEKKFIYREIMKYWYLPFFCLKNVSKIGVYASIIHKYKPKAIIVHSEYSFTSSILTEYCNFMGVKHINVMHGEKLFNIRDSFFKFNQFYVWDEHYIRLLSELRAATEQFIVDVPTNINLNISRQREHEYEYTYYLGNERVEDLLEIKKYLLKLNVPKKKVCIRYHPRYSSKDQITRIFKGFHIEDPLEVSISESLSNSKFIISLYSTVLYQAYKNNKSIIIDDLSQGDVYKKLKELKYIMINKPHLCLSSIIKKN
jgi:uncharacterized SAM-binding protein YcdF (DUF218 family)